MPRHVFAAIVALVAVIFTQSQAAPAADILLKGGTILDGTGGKPYEGSVAIRDGHITAVGPDADAASARKPSTAKASSSAPASSIFTTTATPPFFMTPAAAPVAT